MQGARPRAGEIASAPGMVIGGHEEVLRIRRSRSGDENWPGQVELDQPLTAIRIDIAEVRVVEYIEHFQQQGGLQPFVDRYVFADADVGADLRR